jgi:hypothetical protein
LLDELFGPFGHEVLSETCAATAWLHTPLQSPDVAPIVRGEKTVLDIRTGGAPIKLEIHRYVCRMRNALYATNQVGLMSETHSTVISAHPLDAGRLLTGRSFGRREKILPDKRLVLHYQTPELDIAGPALCLYFSTGAAVFLRDVVLGVFRAWRLLGQRVPVLVPDTLDDRRKAFLGLAGITDQDLIPVPADRTVRVEDAFVPSRSFARDVRVRHDGRWVDLRFLMEPVDTLAFNALIQGRVGGGRRRRILISRGDAPGRSILNEDAVEDRLAERGFERLHLARMPVDDLVRVFANAEIVLGPHGSGLTNILFSPPGTRIIEIDHPRSDFVAHGLSRVLNQPFRVIGRVADGDRDRKSQVSQTVDLDELCRVVDDEITSIEAARDG